MRYYFYAVNFYKSFLKKEFKNKGVFLFAECRLFFFLPQFWSLPLAPTKVGLGIQLKHVVGEG